jgi:RNA polymerase sigma-70 factor, ECF subfamily
MAAYRAGDAVAFDKLYALLGPKMHAFFMRSFNDRAVADDLLQTTMLKLHRARGEFRDGLPLRPWVFAIAARVRLDEYRKRRRVTEELDEERLAQTEEQGGTPEDTATGRVDAGDRAASVRAALAALPESQRVVIHLHRFEGLTFAEIGAALGTSEGAVKLRAFRAYEQLRKQLRPLLAGSGPEPEKQTEAQKGSGNERKKERAGS